MNTTTYHKDPPYYVDDEMIARLRELFSQPDQDVTTVADKLAYDCPWIDRRQAGFAAIWGRDEYRPKAETVEEMGRRINGELFA